MILIFSLLFLKVHFLSGLTKTACDAESFACDPRGIGGSEKDRGRSNVIGLTDAAEWCLRFNAFAKIALVETGCAYTFRFHHAGIDGVNADFARTEFLRQRPGDRVDRAFCGSINRRTRRRQRRDGRTNIDNIATSRIELLDRLLSGEKQTENLHIELFGDVSADSLRSAGHDRDFSV